MAEPTYLVDVRTLLDDLGATIELDAAIEIPVIELGTETFAPIRPVRLEGAVTNTGAGIVASGRLDAEFTAACSRCLREFALRVEAHLDAFFVAHGHDDELPEEQEFGYIAEGSVDLMEQILAALVLALPFAPLHAEDCPGICPQCGADLVDGPCGCEPDRSDSPFARYPSGRPPAPCATRVEPITRWRHLRVRCAPSAISRSSRTGYARIAGTMTAGRSSTPSSANGAGPRRRSRSCVRIEEGFFARGVLRAPQRRCSRRLT